MAKLEMEEVVNNNRQWFASSRFFNDLSYTLVFAASGRPYIRNETYAFTDMFGRYLSRKHYRLHPINNEIKIDGLIDDIFDTVEACDKWLKEN